MNLVVTSCDCQTITSCHLFLYSYDIAFCSSSDTSQTSLRYLSRMPHHPGAQMLQVLDLSGNNLGDDGCASVIRALSSAENLIRAIDLSRNHVGRSARELVDALVGARRGSGTSYTGKGLIWCHWRSVNYCTVYEDQHSKVVNC
jgi:hypothetical protein